VQWVLEALWNRVGCQCLAKALAPGVLFLIQSVVVVGVTDFIDQQKDEVALLCTGQYQLQNGGARLGSKRRFYLEEATKHVMMTA
jgi:hypothetical protein